ncbi:hypothetical protein PAMP_008525 [Pampus punctatissimus]
MLRFMVFCHVWFLQTHLIRCSENSTGLQLESFISEDGLSRPAVIRFSVPEDHHLHLPCRGSDGSDVIWTRHDFLVSAGWTLLLPCSGSSKPKQRWYHRRKGGRQVAIFTRYRNGTVKPERGDSRYIFENDALQILDLQPADAGEYLCNKELQARVTVLTVDSETTRIHSSTSPTSTTADMTTDLDEIKTKEKKRFENALLVVAVVTSGLMILLMAAVCVLLTSMKCRRKRKHKRTAARRREDTELQPWKTSNSQTECDALGSSSPAEETIHYASLGRQNWRERPSRTLPDQNHHNVIYSSVFTRPAANGKQQHTQSGMKFYI